MHHHHHHSTNELDVNDIYDHLNEKYSQFNDVTFSKPSTNYLKPGWILDTHFTFGTSSEFYNKSFDALSFNHVDSEFNMSTCNDDSECGGVSTCTAPAYTKNKDGDAKKLCTVPADKILDAIYDNIVSAKRSVDIVTLQPMDISHLNLSFSSGAFTATIKNALSQLAKNTQYSDHHITVRLLQGSFTPMLGYDAESEEEEIRQLSLTQTNYLSEIASVLPEVNNLDITVGSVRSCNKLISNCGNNNSQKDVLLNVAWNHGKIINVDNQSVITGGHNLWGADYLQRNPVNDLSINILGPIASTATKYGNTLWNYVCNNTGTITNTFVTYANGQYTYDCPAHISSTYVAPTDAKNGLAVKVMSISKLNNGVLDKDADQSEVARVYAFKNATKSIKISQQALFFKGAFGKVLHPLKTIDGTVMEALASAIYKGVTVDIVTSSLDGGIYSSGYNSEFVYNYLLNVLHKAPYYLERNYAKTFLDKNLHINFISINGRETNNMSHNKLWIVDDKVFYVGSHNIYPSSLQQFGVIVDDKDATAQLEKQLWTPMWKNSIHVPINNS
uniref:Phospholipase D n=1 Tax=Moritella sp. JT01 TaxID=756698 RepID=UPI002348EE15|nr:Chain A, Phospholipase D [Moritella sp. JT01]7WU1_B Chain B, Phospholipase D [Moritella sp. JT01]7WU1_C Chain C, Phospholipase D [Moritella sp. JT01]7WU1_D Chain D, Phospholipase D [Moritella sp. JT01]7WU1_E Chain E, Phospholipase D [Moritella sp. JT01]7WU1_F Chain F, Phospholipase D [Moritella sp. JT01]